MGHPQLATDTSRVRRWIDMGETPRDPVPRVLAALFTERLGRVVTIEDLGFVRQRAYRETAGRTGVRRHPDGMPWAPERTAAVLTEFTGMDLMLNRRGLVGAGAALTAGSALSNAMHDWLHTDPALAPGRPGTSTIPCTPTPPGSTATRPPRSGRRRSRRWSARSRSSGPGTPPAAADSSARPSSASSTRWAACSPTATPTTSSGACGASPPTSPCSRAGCPTTSASNPPPRSTSSSPRTRPARAATGRAPARRSPAPPARWSTSASRTRPWT